jgi:hypothetical protein
MLTQLLIQLAGVAHNVGTAVNNLISWLVG